jgi:hypothetical protein
MKGQVLLKGEIIIKMLKFGEVMDFFSLENHGPRITHIYMKAF